MKNISAFAKTLSAIFILLIVAMVGYQVYNFFVLTIHTEYAVEASMEDSFEVSGIACRTEKIVQKSSDGYYDIIRENGEKISRGGTIANVYSDVDQVKAQERIRQIMALIEEYSAAVVSIPSYSGDNTNYDFQINTCLRSYEDALHSDQPQAAATALEAFEKSVYVKQIVCGQATDYQQRIEELRQQEASLRSGIAATSGKVVTDASGYFSRNIDGFEEQLVVGSLMEYDVKAFNEIYQKLENGETPAHKEGIAKIITDYKWQYFFVAPKNKTEKYKVGKNISLRFSDSSSDVIDASIIVMREEGDNVLIGVECASLDPDLLVSRILDASVIVKAYSGIRVDRNSIRMVDDQTGVFVKSGSIIKFKKVNVLYMGSSYALIEKTEGGVENYDEVLTDGKNLYDGKIIS